MTLDSEVTVSRIIRERDMYLKWWKEGRVKNEDLRRKNQWLWRKLHAAVPSYLTPEEWAVYLDQSNPHKF